MKKAGITAIVLVVSLVVGAVLSIGAYMLLKPKPSIESTTLSEGFRAIAELSVEEYYFTDIAKADEPLNALGKDLPFTNKKILLVYKGNVKAGIRNFDAVEFSIDEVAQKVIVKAPKVEVTATKIDTSNVEVYDESSGLFNPTKAEDTIKLLSGKEAEAKDKAIKAGILDRAKTRAEEILKSNVESIISGTEQEGYAVEVQWVD